MIPRTPGREEGYDIGNELEKLSIYSISSVICGEDKNDCHVRYVKCRNDLGMKFYIYVDDDGKYSEDENFVCLRMSENKNTLDENVKSLIHLFHPHVNGIVRESYSIDELVSIDFMMISGVDGETICSETFKYSEETYEVDMYLPCFKLTTLYTHPEIVKDSINKFSNYFLNMVITLTNKSLGEFNNSVAEISHNLKNLESIYSRKLKENLKDYENSPNLIYEKREKLWFVIKNINTIFSSFEELKKISNSIVAASNNCKEKRIIEK